jgi:hypothetical protein
MRIIAILIIALLSSLNAATPEIAFTLSHGTAAEEKTRTELQQLLRQYDLSGWTWTHEVVIESGAIPHSHPKLTISTRHYDDPLLLLSTFVHEEYHWCESAHPEEVSQAIAELKKAYPGVPSGGLDGASDEQSSYLHIIVCYAEYQKMKALAGDAHARQLMEFWATDHYRKIYRLVLDNEPAVAEIVRRHGLLPAL